MAWAHGVDVPNCPPATDMALLWLDMVGSSKLVWLETDDSTEFASKQLRNIAAIGRFRTLFDKYFDHLLQKVLDHGGQPLIFSGDGLLSGWPRVNSLTSEGALRTAALCANEVLSDETIKDLKGRPIQSHAVLAFGLCGIEEISTSRYLTYVTFGKALSDLQAATKALRDAPAETQDEAKGHLFLSAAAHPILSADDDPILVPAAGVKPYREFGIIKRLNDKMSNREGGGLPLEPLSESAVLRLAEHWPRAQRSTVGVLINEPDLPSSGADMRRPTVIFASLPDLNSAVAERQDIKRGLEKVVQAATPCVDHHNGLIHQLRVDADGVSLQVIFGALKSRKHDDAARGVRMALDLLDALSSGGFPNSSIGVATDEALGGLIGSDKYRYYMVHGDAVNKAARLAGLEQGAVFCDEQAASDCSAAGDLRFEPFIRRNVKGPTLPMWAIRPLRRVKPEASVPMVGREKELKTLKLALTTAARRQRASVVLLEGESGIGKSRLLLEFQESVKGDTKLRPEMARCLKSSANEIEEQVPYHGWRAIYEQLLDLDELHDIEACRERVRQKLEPEQLKKSSLLNAVLPVEFPDSPYVLRLSPKQRAAERVDLLLALLSEATSNATCAIIIDDAQWLDWASWELAHHVAAELHGLCLILSFTPPLKGETAVYDIVVDTKKMANQVYEKLKSVGELAAIARQHSADLDPKDVGDFLGYLGHGQIVPAEFEQAASEMEKGHVCEPIQKGHVCEPIEKAGRWHVIKTKVETPDHRFGVKEPEQLDKLSDAELEELICKCPGVRLSLQKLSEAEQKELICSRLGVKRADEKVTNKVVELAEGLPFFCIELARTLRDEGMLEFADDGCCMAEPDSTSDLKLPKELEAAIHERVERMGQGPKHTLKVASAAGARFPEALLIDVDPSAKDILDTGKLSGLLEAARADEMKFYAFRHNLIRDAVYLLWDPRERDNTHFQIAEWYRENYVGNRSPNNALLAYHYKKAGKHNCASNYLRLESKRLFKLGLARRAVTTGLDAAALLGRALPNDPANIDEVWKRERAFLTSLLEGRQTDDNVPRPALDKQTVVPLLELLLTVGPFAFQSEEIDLFNLISETAMALTLQRGVDDAATAEVYSMYSIVEGLFVDPMKGVERSRRALALLPDKQEKRYGHIAFVDGWFHNHWVAPLKDSIEQFRLGAEALRPHEEHEEEDLLDVIFRCFNLAAWVIFRAAAGHPLPEVTQTAHENLSKIGDRVMNASFHVKLELQLAKAFAGKTTDPYELTDEQFNQEKDIASILDTELSNQKGQYLVSLVKLHTIFGDWSGAREWKQDLGKRKLRPFISGQIAEIELEQFHGLAALALAAFGDVGKTETLKLKSEGMSCEKRLRQWDRKFREWNKLGDREPTMIGHKADLLDGVMECVNGNTDLAAKQLEKSAQAAMAKPDECSWRDTALAYEYKARTYRKAGRDADASDALEKALDHYGRWGAKKKCDLLADEFGMAWA